LDGTTTVDKNVLLRTESTNLSEFIENKTALNSPNISSDLRNRTSNNPKARHSGTLDTFTSIFKRKTGDRNSKRGEYEPGYNNSLRGKITLPFLKGSKMKDSDESLQDSENHNETENEIILESPKDISELSPKSSSENTEKDIDKHKEEKELQDKKDHDEKEIKENNINDNDKERQKILEKEKELSVKPKPTKLRERFSSFRKNRDKEEQKQLDPSPLST